MCGDRHCKDNCSMQVGLMPPRSNMMLTNVMLTNMMLMLDLGGRLRLSLHPFQPKQRNKE